MNKKVNRKVVRKMAKKIELEKIELFFILRGLEQNLKVYVKDKNTKYEEGSTVEVIEKMAQLYIKIRNFRKTL